MNTRTRGPTSPESAEVIPGTFPLSALHEVNERCLELLVTAARSDASPPFALVTPLRELLRATGPPLRRRAAECGFLLLDMEFHDPLWWRAIRKQPGIQWRPGKWRGAFPRGVAVPLARATLMLVWHSVRSDLDTACALLGLARAVAEQISDRHLSEVDQIAARRARHLYPRWYDQPLVWRALLLAVNSEKPAALRNFRVHGVQLITGDLSIADNAGPVAEPTKPCQRD